MALAALALASWAALLTGRALTASAPFDGTIADGPFQLFNILRRIAIGQRIGVDFEFFHGAGLPYLYYPAFRALGGTLFGSEFTRQELGVLLFPSVTFGFFYAWTRNRRRAFVLTAVAIGVLLGNFSLFLPENSLIGIRSMMPVVVTSLLLIDGRRPRTALLAGIALGLALWLGTEQGLAAIGALVVVQASSAIATRSERWPILRSAAITLAAALSTIVCAVVSTSGIAGATTALKYTLRDVPRDQFWYFGAPPNNFLYSLRQIPEYAYVDVMWLLGIGWAVWWLRALWRVRRERDARATAKASAASFSIVYGLAASASSLGAISHTYSQALHRSLVFMALALGSDWISCRGEVRPSPRHSWRLAASWAAIFVATALYVVRQEAPARWIHIAAAVRSSLPTAMRLAGSRVRYSPEWAEYLDRSTRYVESVPTASREGSPRLWSTYAGALEAHYGIFHPSFDYIIHALGPDNRARYLATFEQYHADVVQTMRPSDFRYEEWLQTTTWPFYETLLQNYEAIGLTRWTVFWRRRPTPRLLGGVQMAVALGHDSLHVVLPRGALATDGDAAPQPLRLLTADVSYELHNPWTWLPVFGQTPRFLIYIDGARNAIPVSLPPMQRHVSFPVYLTPASHPTLRAQVESLLPGATLRLTSVNVHTTPLFGADTSLIGS